MSFYRVAFFAVLFLFLGGCSSKADRAPAIGEAYVGPFSLNLRKELAPKSPVVAAVKHGDRLEILQTRRGFSKVRTSQGVEGWTDGRMLLTPQQMDELRGLAERAGKLPSQGSATVYEALNMHTEPSRQSPSFFQLPENGSVQVIGHRVAPRNAPPESLPARPAPASKPASARKSKPKKDDAKRIPPPPSPPSPAVPPNWLELSKVGEEVLSESPADKKTPAPAATAAPVPMEDWSLVRTKDGKVGWVLANMLTMSIPDEVAQYAEGHRITSYHAMGEVKDKEKGVTKQNWVWTTITQGQQPYQYDSFRVFVWSLRHHRYETAYIERNIKGYYPVETGTATSKEGKTTVMVPSFSVIVEGDDGRVYRETYAFSGFRVRLIEKTPYDKPTEWPDLRPSAQPTPPAPPSPRRSWYMSIRERLGTWKRGLFGK